MRVDIYQRANMYGQLCFTFDQHNAAVIVGSFDVDPLTLQTRRLARPVGRVHYFGR